MDRKNDFELDFSFLEDEGTEEKITDTESVKDTTKSTEISSKLGRLSTGRVIACIIGGILFSSALAGVVYSMYTNYIRFPREMEVDYKTTGLCCLDLWQGSVHCLEGIGEGSYLAKEIEYANGDEDILSFLEIVASTVSYQPLQIEGVNVYGNTLLDRNGNIVYVNSGVSEGESVTLSYIDYSKIKIDRGTVEKLMSESDVSVGCVDYSNKLVGVFCKYISSLENIPLESVDVVPNMAYLEDENVYCMLEEEDVFLDKLLFSSEEFYDLLNRFSLVAGSIGVENPEWDEWNKLSEKEKEETTEPSKELEELAKTDTWLEWNKLSDEEKENTKEPVMYNPKDIISKTWCGTYYLQNDYTIVDSDGKEVKSSISAGIGDGSFENPAGLDTDVLTYVFVEEELENGSTITNKYPIKIRMIEYGVSEEAISWFESKNQQNRGIDVNSEVQYCYYIFKITNMSDRVLEIKDNSSLCDANANLISRTGTMFSLNDSLVLEPDESGSIETWGRSTELNKRYVIWGKDFNRRVTPVWFRVLAGNIDDNSEDKGVTLNKTRLEE